VRFLRLRSHLPTRRGAALAAALGAAVLVPAAGGATGRGDGPTAVRRVAVVRAGTLPHVGVTQALSGLDDVWSGGYDPPDVQVAAGPGFVFEAVNLAGRVWRTDASPAREAASFRLGDFFGTGNDRLTDPRILYDALGGRWFVSISDEETGEVLLAVSHGSDPTGDWGVYHFRAAAGCADQPRLGTSDRIVVLSADVFDNCDSAFATSLGAEVWAIAKQQLLGGAASADYTTYGPTPAYSSLTPVHSLSATATQYLVSVDEPGSDVVHLLALAAVPPAPIDVREVATPAMKTLLQPVRGLEPGAPGPRGRGPSVPTNDDRVLDAVWEEGRLWFSANGSCVPAGDAAQRSCARVAEVDTAAGAVTWAADIGYAGSSVFFPSLRPDGAGNLVVVFGRSSTAFGPDVDVVARTAAGDFTDPTTVARSAAPHAGSRFGDYFGSARDPSTPGVVWVAGELGPRQGGEGWSTTVASVAVGAASAPIPVAGRVPPGLRARAAGGRAGTPVRLSYVALGDGAGIRREVTVRSGSSIVLRRTTRPGAVRAQRVYSLVWRASPRLHGTFRFCVRSLAGDGTASPQSCAVLRLR
jgi:hypothetical protein